MRRLNARVRRALAIRVEEFCRQKMISTKALAHEAKYDVRTIRNFLNGKVVKEETVHKICAAAGVDFDSEVENQGKAGKSAGPAHGLYSEEFVQNYIGFFYAYRRSFSVPKNIVRSLFKFEWNKSRQCLTFKEFQTYHSSHLDRRVSYDQEGDVFLSNTVGLVHLVTIQLGAVRLITLTRLHHDENYMRGAVLTQAEWPDHFQPSVSPLFLRKVVEKKDLALLLERVGPIEPADADYKEVSRVLEQTEDGVIKFVSGHSR